MAAYQLPVGWGSYQRKLSFMYSLPDCAALQGRQDALRCSVTQQLYAATRMWLLRQIISQQTVLVVSCTPASPAVLALQLTL